MLITNSLGQYIPASSFVHKLDPRLKLIACVVYAICALSIGNAYQLMWCAISVIAILLASRISCREFCSAFKPVMTITLTVTLFNAFLLHTGDPILTFGVITLTKQGIYTALLYGIRLSCVLALGEILLMTTTQMQLADAFVALFSPFARIGFPAREMSMICSLMFRFIPVLAQDISSIIDAQVSRGAQLSSKNPLKRIAYIPSVVVALMASSARHAQDLARALDARGWRLRANNQRTKQLIYATRDLWVFLFMFIFVAGNILLGHIIF